MSEEKKGFFSRLVEGLTKTRNNIMSGFDAIFSGFSNIDEDFYEELEEVLVMADLGIHTTENIIEELKRKVKEQHIKEPQACKQLLADTIKEQMRVDEEAYQFEHQPDDSVSGNHRKRRQDNNHRQTCGTVQKGRQESCSCCSRYIQSSGH